MAADSDRPSGNVRSVLVLVTGGTRGIGRGIADAFADAGDTVVVCGRTAVQTPHEFVAADVRDAADVERLIATVAERHGALDVVINNAGGSPPVDAATASPRFSAAIIALNLTAPLLVAQHANAVMQGQERGGSIINITSVSGLRPSPGTAAYGAAKAGLINLTQSLAVEWAPQVRVNAVSGGLIATEQAELHYGDADAQARVAATIPAGRLGTPADVAAACLFLASPAAEYISGANLVVHGGGERPAFLAATDTR
ncbi:MAG: SDR family oxidoreductase [Actinobacteria bacterium]|nr:SDR family oxidoreductase [Actinomycetota bacterium]